MAQIEGPYSIPEQELPELYALLNRVFRGEREGDMAREYPRHAGACNRENIRVVRQEGRIVSHVATTVRPVLLNGIPTAVAGIGAVATADEARGQGLASILMRDAVERSVAQGADLMLISGDEGIYKRMHAVACGRYPELAVRRADCASGLGVALSPTVEADLDEIVGLRQALSTRYLFPREDLEALLQCKFAMDRPVDWWTVRLSGYAVGWAVVHGNGEEIQLIDWAGAEEVLPEAAGWLLDRYRAERLTCVVPLFSALPMRWRYLVQGVRSFEGTVLVIAAARFLQRAEPYFVERVGEAVWEDLEIEADNQRVVFLWNEERAEFCDGGELARLFFGETQGTILSEKLPGESELIGILKKMFPIPLVWYGIGYV